MNQVPSTAIISHCRRDDNTGKWLIQENDDHCAGVARLTHKFASLFGMGNIGYVAGLLHDLGKERKEFQRYIRTANDMEPCERYRGEHKHSYVGMLASYKIYKKSPISLIMGSIIEAHHRGLYDANEEEIKRRLTESLPEPVKGRLDEIQNAVNRYQQEIQQEIYEVLKGAKPQDAQMLIRMLFSCLVDADRLDTEAFMKGIDIPKRDNCGEMEQLYHTLLSHIRNIESSCVKSDINDIRHYIVEECLTSAQEGKGIFSLTVPTGGGKTISSMIWALRHAMEHGMERIIVAIPYTSIIEQTAQIFKSIFGDDKVIEHHSLVEMDEEADKDEEVTLKRTLENWDAPIIVTTNVQLFESLFSHRPSKCRKLHNICNSVIILDEAQALPISLLSPIVDCLDTLVRRFKCSLLISTATQPALGKEHHGHRKDVILQGFSSVKEIIPVGADLFGKMKRVNVTHLNKPRTYDEVTEEMMRHDRVLCIVNTKKDAYELYRRLPKEGHVFHLSRDMYPAHIRREINEIKKLLKDPDCKDIRVVSTQLIEAGVDIDFPVVMRQEVGLDSIIQAAGRCNREGRMGMGEVIVYCIKDRNPCSGVMARGNAARQSLECWTEIDRLDVIEDYYTRLYSRCDSFDQIKVKSGAYAGDRSVRELLNHCPYFQTVGENFKLIDENTRSIIVKCEENEEDVQRLKCGIVNKHLMRRLAAYSVGVRDHTFKKMVSEGMIELYPNDFYVMENPYFYGDTGIKINEETTEDIFIL